MIDNGGTLNGNFESIMNKPVPIIPLNKPENVDLISEENKRFLIDLSSLSVFGYVIFAFLKSYILWRFL
jgi:hypothetical protein